MFEYRLIMTAKNWKIKSRFKMPPCPGTLAPQVKIDIVVGWKKKIDIDNDMYHLMTFVNGAVRVQLSFAVLLVLSPLSGIFPAVDPLHGSVSVQFSLHPISVIIAAFQIRQLFEPESGFAGDRRGQLVMVMMMLFVGSQLEHLRDGLLQVGQPRLLGFGVQANQAQLILRHLEVNFQRILLRIPVQDPNGVQRVRDEAGVTRVGDGQKVVRQHDPRFGAEGTLIGDGNRDVFGIQQNPSFVLFQRLEFGAFGLIPKVPGVSGDLGYTESQHGNLSRYRGFRKYRISWGLQKCPLFPKIRKVWAFSLQNFNSGIAKISVTPENPVQ